jgi:hypothetical protein
MLSFVEYGGTWWNKVERGGKLLNVVEKLLNVVLGRA